jgi:hypothetical protein
LYAIPRIDTVPDERSSTDKISPYGKPSGTFGNIFALLFSFIGSDHVGPFISGNTEVC